MTAIVSRERKASHAAQRADLSGALEDLDKVALALTGGRVREAQTHLARAALQVANAQRLQQTEPNPGAYSPAARAFVGEEMGHLIADRGYTPERAAAAALDQARRRGYKVPASNPLLALLNPGRRDEQLGTALYEIVYQHVHDGDRSPPRKHVFDRPDGVSLWILNDYQVLVQASGQELVGWFTPSGRRVR